MACGRETALQCVALLIGQQSALPWTEAQPAAGDQGQPQNLLNSGQLDSLVAPLALYPDPILSQVLVASTYPLEIVEAARWVKANPSLQGKALTDAAAKQPWDASVQAGGWGWNAGWGHNNVVVNNNFINSNHFNHVNVANGNNWVHNPCHRGGVPYTNGNVANRFGNVRGYTVSRPDAAQTQQRFNQWSRAAGRMAWLGKAGLDKEAPAVSVPGNG